MEAARAQSRREEQAEQAKAVVRRLYREVFNEGRLEVIDELVAEQGVDYEHLPDADGDLRANLKGWLAVLRTAFPDYHVEVKDLIAEGDRVAVRTVVTGTNCGDFMGMPANGKRIRVGGMDIVRVADGRIVEHWGVSDSAALLDQLDAI